MTGPEVVLDVNTLDAGTGYLDLGLSIVSPRRDLLAYSVDTSGDEVFALRFRDLRTGADLPDVVGASATPAPGASDSSALASSTPCPTSRGGTSGSAAPARHAAAADIDVLVEPDRRFEVTVRRCRSEQAIVVLSESRDTREAWYVDPTGADWSPRSLGGRRPGSSTAPSTSADGDFLAGHRRRRGRVPAGVLPGPGRRRAGPLGLARGRGPRTPPSGWSGSTPSRGTWWSTLRRGGDRMLRVLAADDLAGPGIEVTSRFAGGEIRLARNTWYDAATVAVTDESHTSRWCTPRSPWPTAR